MIPVLFQFAVNMRACHLILFAKTSEKNLAEKEGEVKITVKR
jgi:hypothetical protein